MQKHGGEQQHCTSGEVGVIWYCWSITWGVGNTASALGCHPEPSSGGGGSKTSEKESSSVLPSTMPSFRQPGTGIFRILLDFPYCNLILEVHSHNA